MRQALSTASSEDLHDEGEVAANRDNLREERFDEGCAIGAHLQRTRWVRCGGKARSNATTLPGSIEVAAAWLKLRRQSKQLYFAAPRPRISPQFANALIP